MSWTCGIIGLPNAVRPHLQRLDRVRAEVASYLLQHHRPQHRMVPVPGSAPLDCWKQLGRLLKPQKLTPAVIEFVDVAGLIEGASKGKGLGNQFLAAIREVDLLTTWCAASGPRSVPHPLGGLDAVRDVEVVETELLLSDLEIVGRQRLKAEKAARVGDKVAGGRPARPAQGRGRV